MPIIEEMMNPETGIVPVVLHVRNDPIELPDDCNKEKRRALPGRTTPDVPYLATVGDGFSEGLANQLMSPLASLNNSRQGHVDHAKVAMIERIGPAAFITADVKKRIESPGKTIGKPGTPGWTVCPKETFESADLSMSWWLSPITQRFADLQLCDAVEDTSAVKKTENPSAANAVRRVLRSMPCARTVCRPNGSLDPGADLEDMPSPISGEPLDVFFRQVVRPEIFKVFQLDRNGW
jgi:hypothetical protein